MNTMNDNIQELLERGRAFTAEELSDREKEELASYKQLFAILEQEPAIQIPRHFPEKVVSKIRAKRDAKREILLNSLLAILISGFLFYLPVIITGSSIRAVAATFLAYKWIAVFIALLFMLTYFTGGILKHRKA